MLSLKQHCLMKEAKRRTSLAKSDKTQRSRESDSRGASSTVKLLKRQEHAFSFREAAGPAHLYLGIYARPSQDVHCLPSSSFPFLKTGESKSART